MLVLKNLSLLLPFSILASLSVAFPTANPAHDVASSISIMSKRVDGDGDTPVKDAEEDQKIPPPISGPSYADWMKNLYDMGGKGGGKRRRDNLHQYKTTISEEEVDAWGLAREGPYGYGRDIGH